MVKRSKEPSDQVPDQTSQQLQVPEVGRAFPNPSDMVAVSTPLSRSPFPNGKQPLPSAVKDVDPDGAERPRPNMLKASMILTRPVLARFTSMGSEMIGDCAIASGLQIRQPVKMKVSFSDDGKWGFLLPVHKDATRAIPVSWSKQGEASLNLWKAFEGTGKLVPKDIREVYTLHRTEGTIRIHDEVGYGMLFSLEAYEEETISRQEEGAAPAVKTTKSTSTKAKTASPAPDAINKATETEPKSAQPNQNPEQASKTAEDELATLESQLGMLEEELATTSEDKEILLKMINQRDAQIQALEARLKAIEAKQTSDK